MKRGGKMLKLLKEYWFIPAAAMVCLITLAAGIKFVLVVGPSMLPTLKSGQVVVISTKYDSIDRYDVIVFSKPGDKSLIKRVIGLPGEKIQIKFNHIYINDQRIEDAVNIDMENYGVLEDGVVLEDDEYFAMGDNRNNSRDCREFGPVKKSEIKGKVKMNQTTNQNV